jgi:hypothetical protein
MLVRIAVTNVPVPGIDTGEAGPVGKTASSFVAMNKHPGTLCAYVVASTLFFVVKNINFSLLADNK